MYLFKRYKEIIIWSEQLLIWKLIMELRSTIKKLTWRRKNNIFIN